jgi:hypothetical protein
MLSQITRLLKAVAAAALRIGFLIRGGATIGKLYHANGVVFGEAMIDAFELEVRTAIYPRIVLSHKITQREEWSTQTLFVSKDQDGIYTVDYIRMLLFHSAASGVTHTANAKLWFDTVVPVVADNLRSLEANGRLKELAKWTWFAKRFRTSLEQLPAEVLKSVGICLDKIPWQ